MSIIYQFSPISREIYLKVTLLKSMSYCRVVWGLYHQGWAMMRDGADHVFPFWLSASQAQRYANTHWPHYQPRRIYPVDFKDSLLPTLSRLQVKPALCYSTSLRFKLNPQLMQHMFFEKSLDAH